MGDFRKIWIKIRNLKQGSMSKVPHHPELEAFQAPKIDKEKDVEF